jgi:hypothetical protein
MRHHGQACASEGLAWARAGQSASDPRLALASALGNRALGRLLARAPNGETEASGPSPRSRGGADSPAPNLEIENGRIKLYRAVGPGEAAAIMRHGDFQYSPHGAGKYFAFSKQDAINAGNKLYPGKATIVETTVPRAFVPSRPDVRDTVHHPHIRAREPGAVMIEGEVIVFYDPGAGGWTIHVDDNALDVMNSQMSRPKIIESPLPSIGTPSRVGGEPTGGEPNLETKAESNVERDVLTKAERSVEARVETRTTPVVAPGAYPIESPIDGNAATIEGAAQALLAMQLKQMQATEAAKAYDAWDRLQPKMDEARSKGRWVRVGLHLEVPEKIDVIGGVVGIGDISQIVWFRTMWIEVMETREQAYGTTKRGDPEPIRSTMSAADPHQQPDDVPHPHTRIVATQLVLPPYPTGEKHGRTVLRQKPGFVGTYRPIAFRDVSGNEAAVKAFGMQRKLTIGDRGRDDIAMLDASDSQPLWPSSTWVDTHARTANGTFYKQTEALQMQYIFRSKFTYIPGGLDTLRESVQAEDTDPSWSLNSKWSATIYWAKL